MTKISLAISFAVICAFFYFFHRKTYSVEKYIMFILLSLPFMDLKLTKESWGGFKMFDIITVYSLAFLGKDFIKMHFQRSLGFYYKLFFFFLLVLLLGTLLSESPNNSYISIFKIFPIFIFIRFMYIACLRDVDFLFKIIKALRASYLFALAFLFIQVAVGTQFTFYSGLSANAMGIGGYDVRYPGIFYDSQTHGQYLAIGSFLFLSTSDKKPLRFRYLDYFIFTISIIALFFAGSRSAFGAVCVGLAVAMFFSGRKFFVSSLLIIGVIVTFYFIVSPSSGIFSRVQNLDEDYTFRKSIWKSAYDIALDHPFFGIGIGNYQKYVSIHAQDQFIENENLSLYLDQPENGYLKILVESGFVGFTLFALFILLPILKGTAYSRSSSASGIRPSFLIAAIVSWLVAFNTVYSLFDIRMVIIISAILIVLNNLGDSLYAKKDRPLIGLPA